MSDDLQRSLQDYFDHRSFTDGLSSAINRMEKITDAFKTAALDTKLLAVTSVPRSNGESFVLVLVREGQDVSQDEAKSALARAFPDFLPEASITTSVDVFREFSETMIEGSATTFFDRDFCKTYRVSIGGPE